MFQLHTPDTTRGKIPILLLAAGPSSRMGRSKQLLPVHGKPLLQTIVNELVAAGTGEVIVVLGAYAKDHKKTISSHRIKTIENGQWQNGMGSSIKVGLNFIQEQVARPEAIIISVCDQPHLASGHIIALAHLYRTSKKTIVASTYNGAIGVPVLFDKSHFASLAKINDNEGAKNIIQQNLAQTATLPFPLGGMDLDTMEDYNRFIQ
ncbi:MAG TPA: nucleotidyltransferase family protein [Cyclobacteriaceae bacterium]|nr:nucleotidyltransferase family protein [Cyclobacteriaceae bacterium]